MSGGPSGSVIGDLRLAVGQMGDLRFRRVLWRGVALAAALLLGLTVILWRLAAGLAGDGVTLPWFGEVGWLGDALGWAVLVAALAGSVVLMIPVAAAIVSLFLDDVAAAVEAAHYPGLPAVGGLGLGESLRDSGGFLALVVGANAVAVVFYLLLAPLAPVIFVALNGFLLGREYFQVAAARRFGRAGAARLRRRHRGQIWLAGCLMALPLSVPLLNLVVPVVGAAAFTHMVHRLSADVGGPSGGGFGGG